VIYFNAPYTDVRVEAPMVHTLADLKRIFPASLKSVDFHPPASGPEIELTFATPEGAEPAAEDTVRDAVERHLGCEVLAIRQRQSEDRGGEIDPSLLRSWAERLENLFGTGRLR
jgi:Rieske Fe-S protein